MQTHVPTMFLTTIVVALTMSVSVAAGFSRGQRDGIRYWALALACYAVAYSLFALRGRIPDLVSIVLANGIFAAMYALFAEALCQFQQRPAPRLLIWLPVAATVLSFLALMDNFTVRIILNCVLSISQILLLLAMLWGGRQTTVGRGQYFLAIGFIVLIIFYGLRAVLTIRGSAGLVSISSASPLQTLTYLVAIILLPWLAIGYLIMTREKLEECNRVLATHDQLTGLANRHRMEAVLAREWRHAARTGHPLAVAMVDIDMFKEYNDVYGHPAGDACLISVAQVLQAGMRRPADVAVRYGGEEFILILPETEAAAAWQVIDRLRQSLEAQALPHRGSPLGRVTFSAGVAVAKGSTFPDVHALLRAADAALYQAKDDGRNNVRLATDHPPANLACQPSMSV